MKKSLISKSIDYLKPSVDRVFRLHKDIETYSKNHIELVAFLYIIAFGTLLLTQMVPHPWVNDEGAYYLTSQSVFYNGNLFIDNGLSELNHSELNLHATVRASDGSKQTLIGLFPPFYGFFTAPFMSLWGDYGAIIMNLISFTLTLELIYLISKKVLKSALHGFYCLVLFSAATYSARYAIEIWPHSLSVFLTLFPAYVLLTNPSYPLVLLAGFSSTLAVGIRYQNIMFLPIFFLYLLICHTKRKTIVFTLASLVPLYLIYLINKTVFGSATKTGIGDLSIWTYQWIYQSLFIPYILIAILSYHYRARLFKKIHENSLASNLIIVIISALILFPLASPEFLIKPLYFIYSILVDWAANSNFENIPSKRAVLQTSPILFLSLFGLRKVYKKVDKPSFYFLLAIPILEIIFIGGIHRGDGSALLMRYLLEAIPYMCIFATPAIVDMMSGLKARLKSHFDEDGGGTREIIIFYNIIIVLIVEAFSIIAPTGVLLIAYKIPLMICLSLYILIRANNNYQHDTTIYYLIFILLIYSICVNFTQVVYSSSSKWYLQDYSDDLGKIIEPNSVIMYSEPMGELSFIPHKWSKNLTIAQLEYGNKTSNLELVKYFQNRNRTIYFIQNENVSLDVNVNKMIYETNARHIASLRNKTFIYILK